VPHEQDRLYVSAVKRRSGSAVHRRAAHRAEQPTLFESGEETTPPLRGCAGEGFGSLGTWLTRGERLGYGGGCGELQVHSYLTRVLYNRRNKFDPLWNSLVVAGVEKGVAFLGTVAMIGTQFEDSHIATGFGAHLARPLFRCGFVRRPAPLSSCPRVSQAPSQPLRSR